MNKARPWSDQEKEILLRMRNSGAHTTQIAELLHRTDQAVRLKLRVLGQNSDNPPRTPQAPLSPNIPSTEFLTPPEIKVSEEIETEEGEIEAFERQISSRWEAQLQRQRHLEERIIALFKERFEAFLPSKQAITPPPPSKKTDQELLSAVLLLGDCHVGEIVSREQTHGFSHYDPLEYCRRLHYLENTVVHLLQENSIGEIDELNVILLGDILHGQLQHDAEREPTLLMIDQFELALYTLHQTLARIATVVPRMLVDTVVGNHGRWTNQKRMPSINRFSNADGLLYGALKHSLRVQGLQNIEFHLNRAPTQVIKIKTCTLVASHGDHLRGGNGIGGPANAITREVGVQAQRYAAHDRGRLDYYVCGDKHRPTTYPLPTGQYIINGAFADADEYSMAFAPVEPIQLLFWIHPEQRKTYEYPIKLQFAPPLETFPYELPERLQYIVRQS